MRPWYALNLNAARALLGVLSPFDVSGADHIPAGACIIASSHRSYFDPPRIAVASNVELHFLAKRELFRVPLLGPLIRSLNALPLTRDRPRKSDLEVAVAVLSRGGKLLVFPEGARNKGEGFLPAKRGIALLALNAKLPVPPPIVPCYIHPKGRGFLVLFGPSWYFDPARRQDSGMRDMIAAEVMRRISVLKQQAEDDEDRLAFGEDEPD